MWHRMLRLLGENGMDGFSRIQTNVFVMIIPDNQILTTPDVDDEIPAPIYQNIVVWI